MSDNRRRRSEEPEPESILFGALIGVAAIGGIAYGISKLFSSESNDDRKRINPRTNVRPNPIRNPAYTSGPRFDSHSDGPGYPSLTDQYEYSQSENFFRVRREPQAQAYLLQEESLRRESNPASVLSDIKAQMRLNGDFKTKKMFIIENLVKGKMIDALKRTSPLFSLLYREIHHTGSYYDGLSCGNSYDFDLNVTLAIDVLCPILEFVEVEKGGFLQLQLTTKTLNSQKPAWSAQWVNFVKFLTTPTDSSNSKYWIDPAKVRSWFQSVLKVSAIEDLRDENVTKVSVHAAGPGFNLMIWTSYQELPINVDLVPVLEFKCICLGEIRPIYSVLHQHDWTNESFFLVPKPLKGVENTSTFWRIDFHKIEANILKGFSKVIIKFLKALRNGNSVRMHGISSYALKSVVLLLMRDEPELEWNESNMTSLFLHALKSLRDHLISNGGIPYFFQPSCDLLWNMNLIRRKEISTWLTKSIIEMEASMKTPECRKVWTRIFAFE